MIGEIKITDKNGKHIGTVKPEMMPLGFDTETTIGGKKFKLTYSHSRDEAGRRDMDKIKGIVLTGN